MKTFFRPLCILLVLQLLLSHLTYAQNNNAVKKNILGKWKIADIDGHALDHSNMSTEEIKIFDEKMKELTDHSSLYFKKEGSYEFSMLVDGKEEKENGTWSINEKGDVLTTIAKNGHRSDLKIIELKPDKMILMEADSKLTLVR